MALSLLSHFTRHRHQVLFRPCIHSLRQAPQVRFTRSKNVKKLGALQLAPLRIFGVIGDFRASSFENSNCLIFGIWLKKYTSELILPRRDPSFSSLWCQDARDIEHGLMFCLSHHLSLSSGSFQARYSFFQVASLGQICQVQIGDPWYAPYRGHCVCVYTVIANGSIFVHRACVILMKQGDHPCAVCDGPTKRPQYMRISRLITVTYLPSIEMY